MRATRGLPREPARTRDGRSFAFAYVIRETYGGSMHHGDGEPVATLANVAVVVASCVSALLIVSLFQARSPIGPSSLEKSTRSSEK